MKLCFLYLVMPVCVFGYDVTLITRCLQQLGQSSAVIEAGGVLGKLHRSVSASGSLPKDNQISNVIISRLKLWLLISLGQMVRWASDHVSLGIMGSFHMSVSTPSSLLRNLHIPPL
jgi:hypothetical protein